MPVGTVMVGGVGMAAVWRGSSRLAYPLRLLLPFAPPSHSACATGDRFQVLFRGYSLFFSSPFSPFFVYRGGEFRPADDRVLDAGREPVTGCILVGGWRQERRKVFAVTSGSVYVVCYSLNSPPHATTTTERQRRLDAAYLPAIVPAASTHGNAFAAATRSASLPATIAFMALLPARCRVVSQVSYAVAACFSRFSLDILPPPITEERT